MSEGEGKKKQSEELSELKKAEARGVGGLCGEMGVKEDAKNQQTQDEGK